MSNRVRAAWALLPLLLVPCLLVACGGDDDSAGNAGSNESTTSNDVAKETGDTLDDAGDGSTTTVATTNGTEFSDPQGSYRILVDPTWATDDQHLAGPETEGWFVADEVNGLKPNLTVITQQSPTPDLEDFLDLSLQESSRPEGMELVDRKTVDGTNGVKLGRVELSASTNGQNLRLLQLTFVTADQAVTAVLTAPEDRYAEVLPTVEPYMLTLQPPQ